MAQNESRVAGLEGRVAELSESAGSVERLRQQDQLTIQKLRDRIVQVSFRLAVLTIHSPWPFYFFSLYQYISVENFKYFHYLVLVTRESNCNK